MLYSGDFLSSTSDPERESESEISNSSNSNIVHPINPFISNLPLHNFSIWVSVEKPKSNL